MHVHEPACTAGRVGAGWPRRVRCDCGTHNRGHIQFNPWMIRDAGLEAPEQIGRVERRGDMLKKCQQSSETRTPHAENQLT